MFVIKTSVRRLWALIRALPPDAAVWRQDAFPPVEELLIQFLERQDAWMHSLLQAQLGVKKVSMPAPVQILRPGQEQEKRHVETDPAVIAAFFRQHFGGESVR